MAIRRNHLGRSCVPERAVLRRRLRLLPQQRVHVHALLPHVDMTRDYMIALQRRFYVKSERTTELGYGVEEAYDTLHNELSREQQKLLLRFLDAEEHFRDEEKIDAFCSGFKLADGIRHELGAPYSYEDEDEQQAQEQFRQAHTEDKED